VVEAGGGALALCFFEERGKWKEEERGEEGEQ
jgi:hypothetical protein